MPPMVRIVRDPIAEAKSFIAEHVFLGKSDEWPVEMTLECLYASQIIEALLKIIDPKTPIKGWVVPEDTV